MSFLLDPPMLVASGVMIERTVPEDLRDLAEAATMSTFVGVSIALYLEVPGLGLLWRPFGSRDGRDFMINSGVLRIDTEDPGWRTHCVSAAIFATYPVFMKLGRRIGRRRKGSGEKGSGETPSRGTPALTAGSPG